MLCSAELELFDLSSNATVQFLETIIRISNSYGIFHKYICLFLCVIGIFANLVHILVLTRPVMNKSGVNRLLSIIALCDIFIMISYTFFIIRFGFMVDLNNPPVGYELRWIVFLMIHVIVSIAFHTIALYLWVATAYIRYKSLKKLGSKWNRQDSACPIFIVILAIILVLCVPTFLVSNTVSCKKSFTQNKN
uniref:G-protein coupled receptors family 1 profile domain-containing protein n=1 Tax=Acrobeloides nanus TaxID=290746 RepID=A0A914CZF0_9BILA